MFLYKPIITLLYFYTFCINPSIHAFWLLVHSFNKCVLEACYVPVSVPDTGDRGMNKMDIIPVFRSFHLNGGIQVVSKQRKELQNILVAVKEINNGRSCHKMTLGEGRNAFEWRAPLWDNDIEVWMKNKKKPALQDPGRESCKCKGHDTKQTQVFSSCWQKPSVTETWWGGVMACAKLEKEVGPDCTEFCRL